MDPHNPRILYAAIWQTRRNFWNLSSGGPDSGLYKSSDGGDTWPEITNNPGLPKGLKGRMGVAVSPAKTGRVWATIEAEDCGLYRSDDAGATWELVSDDRDLQGRPWYYQHVFAVAGAAAGWGKGPWPGIGMKLRRSPLPWPSRHRSLLAVLRWVV